MADAITEMNLKTIARGAYFIQSRVEKLKNEGLSENMSEKEVTPAAKNTMTKIVKLALHNKVPGEDILDAIHKGSEEARHQQ